MFIFMETLVYNLKQNICLSCISDDIEEKKKLQDFIEWILDIEDGKTTSDDGDDNNRFGGVTTLQDN
jgi:hypothetical protein